MFAYYIYVSLYFIAAVLGTHHDRSSHVFWNIVTKLPLQGNQYVCWKFCHLLHKLLRDGYPTVGCQISQIIEAYSLIYQFILLIKLLN